METVDYKKEDTKKQKGSVYEIPLEQAATYTKAWADGKRNTSGIAHEGHFIKAFLIDAQELGDILTGEYNGKKPSYIRVYLGLDESQEVYRREKLVAVPVDEFGFDLIAHKDTAENSTGSISHVYDFTLPCPPTCDTDSDLYFGPTK